MKTTAKVLGLVLAASLSLFAQGPTWTTSTIQTYNGYDYELWNQNNSGTVSMKLTGDNGQGANAKGGTFEAVWSGTENVLFRAGKKWGSSSTTTVASIGNAVVDFAATWTSGDNVKMLGVYGWAYYPSGSIPTKQENGQNATFSDQIEYYIIQERGTWNSAAQGTNAKRYPNANTTVTIDGVEYEFWVADRINQPMLTGNGNFKQYFSVPKNPSSHRTSGTITVSKHFSEWDKAGMKMSNCRLYEIAMKVESYTGASKNSSGNATVTKNLLTIGGSLPSSSSGGTTTPSSSSSAGNPVACNYQTSFCGGMSFANVSGNTNSIPSGGSCLYIGDFEVIQPSLNSTISINGVENTCGADWDACSYNDRDAAVKVDGGFYVFVKSGSSVNDYENNGWKGIVAKAKPNCTSFGTQSSSSAASTNSSSSSNRSSSSVTNSSSSSSNRSSSSARSSSSSLTVSSSSSVLITSIFPIFNKTPLTQFSVRTNGNDLLIEASAPATIVIYNMSGKKETAFNVSGTQIVNIPLPSGMYFAKVHGVSAQHVRFIIK